MLQINAPIRLRTPARYGGGEVETCAGRLILENVFEVPITEVLTKKSLRTLISAAHDVLGHQKLMKALDQLKSITFAEVTKLGFSLGMNDFVLPSTRSDRIQEAERFAETLLTKCRAKQITEEERVERKVRRWMETIEGLQRDFIQEAGDENPLVIMLQTGARVSMTQVSQLVVAKGIQAQAGGRIIENPVQNCLMTGLGTFDFFMSCYGARKSMADKKMATPISGYLARRLVNAARDLYISMTDCGYTAEGLWLRRCDAEGRTTLSGERVEASRSSEFVVVRSPIFCRATRGICAVCYGYDFSRRAPVRVGTAVGVIAAQSLTEPCTQLTMRSFHTSGAAELKDSPLVIRSAVPGEILVHNVSDGVTRILVGNSSYYVHTHLSSLLVRDGDHVDVGTPLAIYTTKELNNEDIGGKLVTLESYYEAKRGRTHTALVAKLSGKVQIVGYDDVIALRVETGDFQEVKDVPVFVHDNEEVRKGQFLTYGEIGLREYEDDLELAALIFVHRMLQLYGEEGIHPAPSHLEMIFRAMTELVEVEDRPGKFGLLHFGDPGKRRILGVTDVGILYPSWLKNIGFGYTKEGLTRAAMNFSVSRDLPSERIITGEYPLFEPIERDTHGPASNDV